MAGLVLRAVGVVVQGSWHLCSRSGKFQQFVIKCCITKSLSTFVMQKIECMLHVLSWHLVCREFGLTATTRRGKSLDEAVKLFELPLWILNTSVRAEE